ncbi:uncharacterized protein CTRU02_205623 [Colletotrichum truncatum]|uniref:Uncharacterized protein n=1 Tax=Colletotrichum truncatum TaxID=5467 RepID=A0ACC3Z4M3_COLTU|nr:uncharacterized protein CTRU02_09376 [Colletotrichum truncatum]KAF6788567.1 hypothetical protein CTRU02_09376 [Colletotrichum truncatum]
MARSILVRMLSSLLLLAFLAPLASAQALAIYKESDKYKYQGCFNETNDLPETARERALSNGASKVFDMNANMTVPICLSFCSNGTDKEYKYAGVEYSRECWCSQKLSSLATKLDDSACDTPCDGNKNVACGGALKLNVYMIESGGARVMATAWVLLFAGASVFFSL